MAAPPNKASLLRLSWCLRASLQLWLRGPGLPEKLCGASAHRQARQSLPGEPVCPSPGVQQRGPPPDRGQGGGEVLRSVRQGRPHLVGVGIGGPPFPGWEGSRGGFWSRVTHLCTPATGGAFFAGLGLAGCAGPLQPVNPSRKQKPQWRSSLLRPLGTSLPPPRPGGAAPTLSEPGCPPYTRYTWPSSSKSLGPTSARGSQVSASRRSRNCSVRRAHHGSSCEAGCLRSASGLRPVRRPPGVLQGCLGTARPGAHRASVLVSFPWFPDLTERFVVGGGGFLRLSFSLCDLITALRCQVLRGQKWGWYYL